MAGESKKKPERYPGNRKFDLVRAACVEVLNMVLENRRKTDDAINDVLDNNEFTDLDRRFLLQLCHGTVKMKRRLDFIISFYLQRPDIKMDKVTRNILRLGLYQLIFTNRIPHGAAVSETVNLARGMVHHSRGAFVNAILRNFLRDPNKVNYPNKKEDPVTFLANFHSYPDWFVEYCLSEFGYDRTDKLLRRGNDAPQITYRVNSLRYNPSALKRLFEENGIEYKRGEYIDDYFHVNKQGLPLYKELIDTGRVYIQDQSAGIPVKILNPRARDHILDLASAPGGKATYAAAKMNNLGLITCVDINVNRLEVLVENARRHGISIIAPVLCDILDFKGPACKRVLLDTLCSGWGVVGRHSDLRWSKTREDSLKLAEVQGRLLRHTADLVQPGGILVYSTCTIIRDENDQVVEEFLLERPDFVIEKEKYYLPKELISPRGFIKTYPSIENMDGAFCVRLKKKVGSKPKKA